MQKKTLTLLGIILIFCFTAAAPVAGGLLPEGLVLEDNYQGGLAQPIGKFLRVLGDVVVIHEGESVGYRVQKGLPVYKMDTLISLEKSRALIKMNDHSRLSLAPRTRIIVNRSLYNKTRRERSSFYSMAVGKARFWVTKMAKSRRSEFRVKTATAVLGVRGSDFVVDAGLEATVVTTLANTELEVISTTILGEPVILNDFQQTTIDIDVLPSEVIGISLDLADELMNELPVKTIDGVSGETEAEEAAAGPLTGEKSAVPLAVDREPEIFVDDGGLIEPEAIEKVAAVPVPPELIIDKLIQQEQLEAVQETQQDIGQVIYEETVAMELPFFPKKP